MRARAGAVMEALGEHPGPIGIGSANGFEEVVQRSPNRFDVPLDEGLLAPIWGPAGSTATAVPWMGLVTAALGHAPAPVPSFCGVVFSRPGSPAQQWHIDSPHESRSTQCQAHAVNVLVALADIPLAAGPTEVAPGTHLLTNHLREPSLDYDDLLYQTAREITPDQLHRVARLAATTTAASGGDLSSLSTAATTMLAPMEAGDCLVFDDRVLHRGGANVSDTVRWVAYFSYARPRAGMDDAADTHFEATRSLFR